MALNQIEDFNGRIANAAKLANVKEMQTREMISIVSKGSEEISKYLKDKGAKQVEEHKSMLDEFQL